MVRPSAVLLAVAVMLPRPAVAADPYPRPELLAEAADVAKSGAKAVVLDARPRAEYDAGHVTGAHRVDAAGWAKLFGHGGDAEAWGKRVGAFGITAGSKVVVYGAGDASDAARVWWILRYWGVDDVRLLNGGWAAWRAAGLPVAAGENPHPPTPVPFDGKPRPARLATKAQILKSLEVGGLQVVDARSEGEYCGTAKYENKRAGSIPGAKHLEWTELLDKSTHKFKPAGELKTLFDAAGIDLAKPTAAHCQSGGRSSVMAFALELMGAKDVGNYHPSWAEWGAAADTPAVPGKPRAKQ